MQLSDLEALLGRLQQRQRTAGELLLRSEQALVEAQATAEDWSAAQQVVQVVAQSVQQRAHAAIANIVTRCLAAVFTDDPYTFHIDFDRKRGRTEARLYFMRAGAQFDPTEETGIGVVDVAAFALRLAVLLVAKPTPRRVLLLDEPLRCLSKEYRPAVRELLVTLADEMGVQVVITTHSEEFQVGKVVQVKKSNQAD